MPRTYKRPPGVRNYKHFSKENLQLALDEIRKGLISINRASDKYGIHKSTLSRKLRGKNTGDVGRPTILNEKDEKSLADALILASEWGFPLTQYDLRLIVKGFLDRQGIIERRFQGNMPGVDWAKSFLARNKNVLSERLCQNIKRARARVDPETVNSYFDELEVSLNGVSSDLIVNYDETNITDDPSRKKIIARRGCKHPERVIDHSKSSTSVMFSGTASGILLPPYVCYRAENLYDTWTEGGPSGTRYNRSKNGWFNLTVFEDWFFSIAVPFFKKYDVDFPKVLIGDNLSSHISLKVIKECKNLNIRFVLLPPNSTHLCQPLDAAYFRPLKRKWRQLLDEWKSNHRGPVQKDCFPRMLKKCLMELNENGASEKNLISGFKTTGIAPVDRTKVLKNLPGYNGSNSTANNSVECATISNKQSDQSQRDTAWADSLKEFLEEFRKSESSSVKPTQEDCGAKKTNKPKKKKLKVMPGKSVCEEDINELLEEPQAGPSRFKKAVNREVEPDDQSLVVDDPLGCSTPGEKQRKKKKKQIMEESSSGENGHYSTQEISSEMDTETDSDSKCEDDKKKEASLTKILGDTSNLQLDDFVIVKLKYDEGTKKETIKKFIAQISSIEENNWFKVKFMRQSTKAQNIYIFPNEEDLGSVKKKDIIASVTPLFVRRGRFCFPVEM